MIKEAIKKIKLKRDITKNEMVTVFKEIMEATAEKSDVKEFLLALKGKGAHIDEIVAAAEVMREKSTKVNTSVEGLVDTCGTGGAPVNDINISTITSLVLAACGVKIAKHGNRSFTGKCGSTDILMALGVDIKETPDGVAKQIEQIGFGFMHAPYFHPAMKNVADIRKELKTKTIFNILGPLSNPAGAKMQILGVYKPELTELMAEALKRLGTKRAIVVHGLVGLDEISIEGETRISELKDGKVATRNIKPEDFGIEEESIDQIRGGDPEFNKKIVLRIIEGKDKTARRNAVLINAAAALYMIGKVKDFKEGMVNSGEAIDSGRVTSILKKLKKSE